MSDEPTRLPDAYASQDYQKGWREGRASAEDRIASYPVRCGKCANCKLDQLRSNP